MLSCRQRLDEEFRHEVAFEDERLELRQQHERHEHESADQGAIEKDGDDGIIDDGLFLKDVVEAQQEG